MANYYVIRIKFHWDFSYVTHYMRHPLLGTRRVIPSIITRNFFVTQNKQPMTIGTNRMCISIDDNCVNTMCVPRLLPTTARDLPSLLSCGIRVVLSVSLPFSFLSMPQLSKYVSIRPNERFREVPFKVEDQGTWRGQNLHAAIYFATACEEDTN